MFEEGKLEPANLVKLQEALGMFNTFLEGRQYAAGDSITVADHSLIATVSTMEDCGEDNGFRQVLHQNISLNEISLQNPVGIMDFAKFCIKIFL